MSRLVSSSKVEKTTAWDLPKRRRLEGKSVSLEPLDVGTHDEDLYAISHEDKAAKDVWSYLPHGPFDNLAKFRNWLEGMASAENRVVFVFRDKKSQRVGGMANYLDIQPVMGSIEVGYIWFSPSMQRTIQSTEALYLMLSYALDELKYRRMQWRCNALNEKSRDAALRLGFSFEGIFYQHMVVKGHNRDTAWYSILDHEWPRIRENFETWISPENFDDQGYQKQSLSVLNKRTS